ncbi:hypothetical protein D3C80_1387980 [compost metagenome]
MTASKRGDGNGKLIDRCTFCLKDSWEHDLFAIAFPQYYQAGEIDLRKCLHGLPNKFVCICTLRGELDSRDLCTPATIQAKVPDVFRLNPSQH